MSWEKGSKKLVSVLATSIPITIAIKKALGNTETGETEKTSENDENSKNRDENLGTNLIQFLYIWYPITFQKQSILALFDLRSEIHPTFVKELGLSIRSIDIEV